MPEERPLSPTDAEAALAARLERLAQRRPPAPAAAGSVPAAARRRGRRHPARSARYAAVGMSVLSTAGLTSWFAAEASGSTASTRAATIVSAATSITGSDTTAPSQETTAGSSTVVDGAVFHNRWGDVQVEATFAADGTLTSVTTLETPGGRGQSIEINDYAVPRLNSEAVSIQSAQVHTVSGATYTSESYRSSLQSAIDTARAASATTVS